MSETRKKVLDYVREKSPISPKEVAEQLGMKHNNVKQLLFKLALANQVKSDDGKYTPIPP